MRLAVTAVALLLLQGSYDRASEIDASPELFQFQRVLQPSAGAQGQACAVASEKRALLPHVRRIVHVSREIAGRQRAEACLRVASMAISCLLAHDLAGRIGRCFALRALPTSRPEKDRVAVVTAAPS